MNECGVERVLFSMLCVGIRVALPNERAPLLRLLSAVARIRELADPPGPRVVKQIHHRDMLCLTVCEQGSDTSVDNLILNVGVPSGDILMGTKVVAQQ